MKTVLFLALLLAIFLPVPCSRGQLDIASLDRNGTLTWTHATNTIASYTVEWASSPDGPWVSDWNALVAIPPSNTTMSAGVPMFYRVIGQEIPTPSTNMLLSEVAVAPTEAEFVEIYNNTGAGQPLHQVYLADYSDYHMITQGSNPPAATDFRVRFPDGVTIADQARLVVSLQSATNFHAVYGFYPDFDLDPADTNAPAMEGEIGSIRSLSNVGEMLVLFSWDGIDSIVYDIDYLLWGSAANAMDKSTVPGYVPDTTPVNQDFAPAPAEDKSLDRTDMNEGTEISNGGNGVSGHDETSENLSNTWQILNTPTPGLP